MCSYAVKLDNVSKWFGNRQVLNNINFSVGYGEKVAICGTSGAGKSTVLRCIVSLDDWNQGDIYIDGVKVTHNKKNNMFVRSVTGMVFQDFNLFPHLTVLENCTIALTKVKKMSKLSAVRNAMRFLHDMGIGDKAREYVNCLSGGQGQRVAIARSLCMEPKIILLDEPTSALDNKNSSSILKLLLKIVEVKNMTVICVSHDQKFVEDFADRVIFMENGSIVS